MQSISTKPNEPVVPLEVHKLYRPVEFKLTTIYDASKASKNPQGKYLGDAIENNVNKENTNQTEINLHWKEIYKVGPGLTNAGNTCFLNAVMQMLTYTSPFANYLLQKKHSIKCPKINNSQFCALCAFEDHLSKYFKNNTKAIKPYDLIKNIKLINKKFQIGRQEDAQEFLRDLVEAFQKSCTGFLEKPPQKVLESTDITKIFGGKLKSSVECKKCRQKSDTIENFFDLSLEISKGDSLEKCLDGFFKPEELVAPNRYRCSRCNRNTDATKKFSIQQRPLVLTIHLKRFENIQGKINKVSRHINFQETLSLKSYMSHETSESLVYDLQGIIVHVGPLCESGHYYSCIKNSNGIWHQIDDETVKTNKVDLVMKQEAYILTYVLRDDPNKVSENQKDAKQNGSNGIENNSQQQGPSSQVQTKKANALIDEIFGKPSKSSKSLAKVVEEPKSMPEEKPIIPEVPVISKNNNPIIVEQQQPVKNEIKETKKSKKAIPNVSDPTPMEEEEKTEIKPEEHEEFRSLIKLARPKKAPISLLKTSPLVKLKRIAKVIPSLPVKKLKGENKEIPVPNQNESSFDHQADQQEEEGNTNNKLVNTEAIKKKEKKEYQPLIVGKNIFLTKKGGDKKADAALQGWDAPEDDDEGNGNEADDEFKNMLEERNRIFSENQDFFIARKKEKDQYDKDYDKGKLKKVKKNKNKPKCNNNFQKAYEFLSRRKRR